MKAYIDISEGEKQMGSDPEPRTKGEQRRQLILKAIRQHMELRQQDPSLQDIQHLTGIRSFNTLSNQLKILQQQGVIEWDQKSVRFVGESVQ